VCLRGGKFSLRLTKGRSPARHWERRSVYAIHPSCQKVHTHASYPKCGAHPREKIECGGQLIPNGRHN
ncbi:hypothetical protein ACLOJK_039804, partial [Asimina triloba]